MNIPALLSEFHLACRLYRVLGSSRFVSDRFCLFAVLSRQILIRSGGDNLTLYAGQTLVVPPGTPLSMFTQRRTVLLVLSFDRKACLLDDALLRFPLRCVYRPPVDHSLFMHMVECGKDVFSAHLQTLQEEIGETAAVSSKWTLMLLQDLHSLSDHAFEEDFDRRFSHLTSKNASLLKEILDLMRQNSDSVPGLSETARIVGVTPQYLAAFFREHMSVTFMQYRKQQAEGTSVLRAAYQSPSGADEAFDAEAVSSPVYAYSIISAASPAAPEEALSVEAVHNIQKAEPTVLFSQAQEDSALAETSVKILPAGPSEVSGSPSCFHKLINLGFAFQFSDERFWSHVRMTQSEIGFSYGRVCGLLDLIIEYRIHGDTEVNYARIFHVLDGLLSVNLIPFLEMSGRGFRLQLSISESISVSQSDNTSSYNRFLLGILPSFLAACINRYGRENVNKWVFEMTYPFTDYDKGYSLLSYAESFRAFRDIIHACLPGCEVCGPGFNDWLSPQRVTEVLELLHDANALPDSFSAFLYPVYGRPGEYRISGDLSLLSDRLSDLCGAAQRILPGSRVWITEYNSNLSARSAQNDSVLQAAFLASMFTRISQQQLHGFGYYMLSDIPLRYIDTDSLLFGGWGLVSDSGIPKPSYYAMKYLRMLGSEILFRDHNCLLTREGRSIRCLLFREPNVPERYLSGRTALSAASPDADFFIGVSGPEVPQEVTLRFTGLPEGPCQITGWTISENNGNLLRAFRDIEYRRPVAAYAAGALRLAGMPLPILYSAKVGGDGTLDLTVPGIRCGMALIMIDPAS